MTKEIQKKENTLVFNDLEFNLADKSQLTNFQNTYAKWTSAPEFASFIWIIKATWLNPFKKEVWCVKYGSSPAQIFVWRDGYRKVAKQHKDYISHRVDVICENDETEVENWKLTKHKYSFKDRWDIIWAYCIVRKKGFDEEIYNFVDFQEYNTNQSKWKSSPKTMIKKVAEAQTLRMVFDELLEWTYDESEYFENKIETKELPIEEIEAKENKLKDKYQNLASNQTENENI